MQDNQSVSPLALGGALAGILALIFSIVYLFFRSSKPSEETTNEPETKSTSDGKKATAKSTASKSTKLDTKSKFAHPWLCASLKAHSSSITSLAFSHNDKFLASAAEGNFVSLSWARSLQQRAFLQMTVYSFGKRKTSMAKIISTSTTRTLEPDTTFVSFRHTRVNIEFGQANHVAFSPDGR